MNFSRALTAFAFAFITFAGRLVKRARLLGAKRAPVLNWRKTSGGGLGLLVARNLRFVEDRGFPAVAALDLHDFALTLETSEDDRDFGLLEWTPFLSEEGVDIVQRVVAGQPIDGPQDCRGITPVPVPEPLQFRVHIRLGPWQLGCRDGSGFQKRHLRRGKRHTCAAQQGWQEGANVDGPRRAVAARVLVEDFECRQEAFPFQDFLPELLLAFFYFIAGQCHAMQDKQMQCKGGGQRGTNPPGSRHGT